MIYPTKAERRIVCDWLDEVRPEAVHRPADGTMVHKGTWWINVTTGRGRYMWVSQNGVGAASLDQIVNASCQT